MNTLNRQRTNIVFSTLVDQDIVLTPEQAAKQERVFETDGVLRWRASTILGHAKIGVPFQDMLSTLGRVNRNTESTKVSDTDLTKLLDLYRQEGFLCWYDVDRRRATIVLKKGSTPASQLKAWTLALLVACNFQKLEGLDKKEGLKTSSTIEVLNSTLRKHSQNFDRYIERLKAAGWDVDAAALETKPGLRVTSLEAGTL